MPWIAATLWNLVYKLMALNLSFLYSYMDVPYKTVLSQKDSNIERAGTEIQEYFNIF